MEGIIIPLNRMVEGESGSVTRILLTGSMRRRLQDLGLMEGTHVLCYKRAPGGSPVIYWVCGTLVALRDTDARQILVRSRRI